MEAKADAARSTKHKTSQAGGSLLLRPLELPTRRHPRHLWVAKVLWRAVLFRARPTGCDADPARVRCGVAVPPPCGELSDVTGFRFAPATRAGVFAGASKTEHDTAVSNESTHRFWVPAPDEASSQASQLQGLVGDRSDLSLGGRAAEIDTRV